MDWKYERGLLSTNTRILDSTTKGNKRQKARTTLTWQSFLEIEPDDWLVAYLPSNTFCAVGRVIRPRTFLSGTNTLNADLVQRTLEERKHSFLNGFVRYSDAPCDQHLTGSHFQRWVGSQHEAPYSLGGSSPSVFLLRIRDISRMFSFLVFFIYFLSSPPESLEADYHRCSLDLKPASAMSWGIFRQMQ